MSHTTLWIKLGKHFAKWKDPVSWSKWMVRTYEKWAMDLVLQGSTIGRTESNKLDPIDHLVLNSC